MARQHDDFDRFYQYRAAARRRQLHPQQSLHEKLGNVASIITVLIIVATILSRLNTRYDLLPRATSHLWNALVYIIPAYVVFAIDAWKNPENIKPMTTTHAAKSAAMRRILGVDRPGGMMASVFQARTRALSATGNALGLKLINDRPPGLGNHDNSCYQNSILQGLSSLDSLPEFLDTCVSNANPQERDNSVAQTLQTLISDLNDASNKGATLWTPRVLKSMSTWTQQDAQEYYSKVLDDIDKAVSNAIQEQRPVAGLQNNNNIINIINNNNEKTQETAKKTNTETVDGTNRISDPKLSNMKIIRNPLEGLLAQRVACVQCRYSDGLSLIPFNCLTLSLGLDKNEHDIYERMDAYTKSETIDGVECPKCTLLKAQRLLTKLLDRMRDGGSTEDQLAEPTRRLAAVELALEDDIFDDKTLREECKITAQSKVSSTKTKQIVIARPPQSLVVHMNRSVFDPATFHMIKNSAPVRFPMSIDIGPWCLGSSGVVRKQPDQALTVSKDEEEFWQIDPLAPMAAGDLTASRLTGPFYELKAAVTHYGRHENGHYICYRKYKRPAAPKKSEASPSPAPFAVAVPVPDEIDDDDEEQESKEQTQDASKDAESNSVTDEEEESWWRLSDHNVNKVSEDAVMSLAPGVFMLFYECTDPSMILDAESEPELVPALETQDEKQSERAKESTTASDDNDDDDDDDDATTLRTVDTYTDDGTATTVTSVEDEDMDLPTDADKAPKGNGVAL